MEGEDRRGEKQVARGPVPFGRHAWRSLGSVRGWALAVPFVLASSASGSRAASAAEEVAALDATEVTVAAYARCVAAGACSSPDAFVDAPYDPRVFCNWLAPGDRGRHPVNCVDFAQATTYCAWTGQRLPSGSEWEAAAGGRRYPWGDDEPGPLRVNACGPECGAEAGAKGLLGTKRVPWSSDGHPATAPVASFPLGDTADHLSDLSGNVWEWTRDVDPRDPSRRAVRGGAFSSVSAASLLASARTLAPASQRSFAVGFRCAKGRSR